jgi:hypothetical protein
LFRNTSSAPGETVVVVDVVDDVDVVDVLVEVDAAVVTGVVVVVTSVGADVEVEVSTDDDDAVSVAALLSSLHAATVSAMRTRGAIRIDFTVGSLARFVAIT